jgi:hypothetical protein
MHPRDNSLITFRLAQKIATLLATYEQNKPYFYSQFALSLGIQAVTRCDYPESLPHFAAMLTYFIRPTSNASAF